MSAICDRMHCGQAATHRLTGRLYCARHASQIAGDVNSRAGRPVIRLALLGSAGGVAAAGALGA